MQSGDCEAGLREEAVAGRTRGSRYVRRQAPPRSLEDARGATVQYGDVEVSEMPISSFCFLWPAYMSALQSSTGRLRMRAWLGTFIWVAQIGSPLPCLVAATAWSDAWPAGTLEVTRMSRQIIQCRL